MTISKQSSERWLIYALGGGLGHLQRSIALARAAIKTSFRNRNFGLSIEIITNSQFAEFVAQQLEPCPEIRVHRIPAVFRRDNVVAQVNSIFNGSAYDRVIVDTFPRGLAGELPPVLQGLRCPKILVRRKVCLEYRKQPIVENALSAYDCILVPGASEGVEDNTIQVVTDPWLIRDEDEILVRSEATKRLRLQGNALPVVALVGCGNTDEIHQQRELADYLQSHLSQQAELLLISPPSVLGNRENPNCRHVSMWPMMEVYNALDLIVGSGGYNTVNEAVAVGIPLIGMPRKRLYDSQEQRLEYFGLKIPQDRRELLLAIRHEISRMSRSTASPSFRNGVHQAVSDITAIMPTAKMQSD